MTYRNKTRNNNQHNGSAYSSPDSDVPINQQHTGTDPFDSLKQAIIDGIEAGDRMLVQALPGIGKSCCQTTIANENDEQLYIGTNLRDNYDQFQQWAFEDGIPFFKFPTSELCPEYDHSNPWPVGVVHQQDNPHPDRECRYQEMKQKVTELRRKADKGIFVGSPIHLRNPANVKGNVVVLDEDPFDTFIDHVSNPFDIAQPFIDTLDDGVPFDTARLPHAGEAQKSKKAADYIEAEGIDPYENRTGYGDYHPLAPVVAYAIFAARPHDNDRLIADLPGGGNAIFSEDTSRLAIFRPPDLSDAKAVICLDATPNPDKWQAVVGDDLIKRDLFSDEGRREHLRLNGYTFRQLNTHRWSVMNGDRLPSVKKAKAYLHEVADEHGETPDVITSKALLDELPDDLYRDSLHFGDVHGRNDLEESELLVVLGCPSRSDHRIIRNAALIDGRAAEPVTKDDSDKRTGYGDPVANQLLGDVKNEVLQAALRAGRTDDTSATVYIATEMIPDWLDPTLVGKRQLRKDDHGTYTDACHETRKGKMPDVIRAIRGSNGSSNGEIVNKADIASETARKHRQSLEEAGLVKRIGNGPNIRYVDDGLDAVNPFGEVDLTRANEYEDLPSYSDVPQRNE